MVVLSFLSFFPLVQAWYGIVARRFSPALALFLVLLSPFDDPVLPRADDEAKKTICHLGPFRPSSRARWRLPEMKRYLGASPRHEGGLREAGCKLPGRLIVGTVLMGGFGSCHPIRPIRGLATLFSWRAE